MKFEVENITPFDNDNGKGILARVGVHMDEDNPTPDILVYVKIPLNWSASLDEVKQTAIDEAKLMLRSTIDTF